MRRYITFVTLVAVSIRGFLARGHLCNLSRGTTGSAISSDAKWRDVDSQGHVKVDCSSRDMVQIPTDVSSDVTELDLRGNKIHLVQENDFTHMVNLRVLILARNAIKTLQGRCFYHLRYLEQLDLNYNNIECFNSDTFVGLQSLRVFTMSGLPLTSYPTEFVAHTRQLRVLSLSAIGDATIPAEYGRLPRLEVLDLNESRETTKLVKITAAMLDGIRGSNITTLSFRNMFRLSSTETGAFSNMPSARSLIFTCNKRLSFVKTVAALAATTNTSVDTVVLDSARGDGAAIFDELTFCSAFWRRVQRLSVRDTRIVAFTIRQLGCFVQLLQLNVDYNSPISVRSRHFNMSALFPRLIAFSISHRTITNRYSKAKCASRDFSFDADRYFQTKPPLLPIKINEPIYETKPCDKNESVFDLPLSLESIAFSDFRIVKSYNINVCYNTGNLLFLNGSQNKIVKVLCSGCRNVGLNRLEIVDLSFGALEIITDDFFRNYKNLRFLNLSHNALGVSGSDFHETFSYLSRLEDINLSHNKLRQVNPQAFERCARLRRLDLSNNELTEIELTMRYMEALEYIDVSGNRLVRLRDTFTAMLDQHFHVRPIELNAQREMFVCNCESVSFVRWTRVTRVRLTEPDRLICVYKNRDDMPLNHKVLEQLESECDVNVLPVVVPVVVGVILIIFFVSLVRYHRWYIKYHLVLCWLRGGMLSSRAHERDYDAMVLYYQHAASPVDQQGGVARISRWVSRQLMTRVEDQWGLRLYVGDRNDRGAVSKILNFVRGFDNSDKVVVCLTQEFIDDSDCMNYLATAFDSSKPLSKYIFVLFDDIHLTSVPRRLRHLLLPRAPSTTLMLGCLEDGEASDSFWRSLHEALTRDTDQGRCGRRFDAIQVLASYHDTQL
ncbi:hypothetical protein LSAT2_009304 [Lamellibrachia satsuma]|nr:hypothetical protein LSAT2_009304 [Lamellibrachia satsuma]